MSETNVLFLVRICVVTHNCCSSRGRSANLSEPGLVDQRERAQGTDAFTSLLSRSLIGASGKGGGSFLEKGYPGYVALPHGIDVISAYDIKPSSPNPPKLLHKKLSF